MFCLQLLFFPHLPIFLPPSFLDICLVLDKSGHLQNREICIEPKLLLSVLVGEVKTALLDGDSKNYDMERGFSRHPIDDSKDKGCSEHGISYVGDSKHYCCQL